MNAKDVAEPALVFSTSETVSRVIAKMIRTGKHEAMVFDGKPFNSKTLAGAVFANDLVKRKINSPQKAKIGRFVEHVKPARPDMAIEDAIKTFLTNDYKSIPICDGGNFFITKLGVLKSLRNSKELKGRTAGNVMNTPYCIGKDDSIATAISVLRETGVSRLPVIGSDGGPAGLLDSMDLLKARTRKSRMRLGEEVGEKTSTDSAMATNLMRRDFPSVEPGTSLKRVVEAMVVNGMPTAVVVADGRVAGIVTPKPIFRLFAGRQKGVYVRLSGINDESDFIKSVIDDEIAAEMRKLGAMLRIDYLVMHVDKYRKAGRRREYSVKARLVTGKGMFFASDSAWDIAKAVSGTLAKLEREVLRKKGKAKHERNR
jgi:CBS domain-containing protein